MDRNLKKDAEKIIGTIKDPEVQKEVNAVRFHESDPLMSLKGVLFSFFEKRLKSIEEEDTFRKKVKEAILERIESGEVSIPQLISLYNEVSTQSTYATNSILDIFKPNKEGAVSPLVQNNDSESQSGSPTGFENLSGDDSEAMQILTALVSEIQKSRKEQQASKDDSE